MKQVVLLSRVSTELQTLEQQTEQLINYAKAIGYSEEEFEIIEDKESAVKLSEEERNGLNRLKQVVMQYPIKDVVVYELSRIARVPKILYSIRDFLIENHVQLHVLNPSFKLLKPDGTIDESANVIFSLFCSMAENEGYLRKQRFARGRARLASENKFYSGKVPFGYGYNKNKEYIIIEEERDIVVRIFEEYKTRVITEIAKDLMLEEKITAKNLNAATCFVRSILHREAYTGVKTICNGITARKYPAQFPQIISKETFKEAQLKLKGRKKYNKANNKHIYLCRNIVTNINGDLMKPIISHNAYEYIKINKMNWETLSIKIDLIDSIAWYYALENKKRKPGKDIARYKVELRQEIKSISKKVSTIKKKIEECNDKLIKIETRYIDGKIPESTADLLSQKVQKEIELYKEEEQCLEAEGEDLTKKMINISKSGKLPVQDNNSYTIMDKERIIHEEIERIIVIKGQKRFKYTLGIQFFNGDYIMLDTDSLSKRLWDENGAEVAYNN